MVTFVPATTTIYESNTCTPGTHFGAVTRAQEVRAANATPCCQQSTHSTGHMYNKQTHAQLT